MSIPLDHPHALESQVGGHAGVMTTEDGSLLIKPASPLELHFYQSAQSQPQFKALKPFLPKFLGTLKLEGQVDESSTGEGISLKPATEKKDKFFTWALSIVLENLSFPFLKPNILDIKLGTVLYDRNASPEKVTRMEKTARDTTSFESGVRLTGFQVYDNITGQAVNTPKSYGKSIKVADLPDGIARFFPIASETSTSGLPRDTLLPIIRAIRDEVAEIRDAFSSIEVRMVGGSLLVIYEADHARAEEGVKRIATEEGDDDENEDDDDDDDDSSDIDRPGPCYVVKLIDFAHTDLTPGQGPDNGVLLGMDTVLSLLDGRIKEISRG